MVALVALFAFAAMRGHDPTYAWVGTPERHFGVVTWLLLVFAFFAGLNFAAPQRVLWGTAIAGLAVGATATAEAVGWEPRVFAVDDRLSATFGSPAYLGAVTAVMLPIAIATACDRALTREVRLVAAVSVPLLGVAVLGSGARAAWLGLVAAVVLLGARRGRAVASRASVPTVVVIVAVASAAAVAIAVWSPVGSRITSTFDDDAPGGRGRLDEWRVAVHVAGDHLGSGVGPEGYRIAFAEGVDAAYERAHGRDPTPDRAHAGPLDVLVTGGVGALALWVSCVGLVGRYVWRALVDDRRWVAGIGAALIAHFVGQLVLFPVAEIEPLVWMLAGMVVAATSRPRELRPLSPPRLIAGAPAAAAAFALVAGVTDVVADRWAHDAVVALSRGDVQQAYDRASDAASLRPDEVRLHLLEAETARRADRGTVEALAAVDDASAVSPHDPIVVERLLTLLVDRAEATLVPDHARTARDRVAAELRRDPLHAQLRVLEGRAARLAGDDAAAEQAWTLAEDLAPRSPIPAVNLAALYLDQGRLDEARAAIERAEHVAPDDPLVEAVRARVEGTG
jgi:Flp pilus assembly protein TadD